MTTYVEEIIFGGPQPTKLLGFDISGLLYSLMFVQRLGLVSNARNSLGNNNSSPCH
jgi:hypothetical protein